MLMSVNPGPVSQVWSASISLALIIVAHVQKDFMVMGTYVTVKAPACCYALCCNYLIWNHSIAFFSARMFLQYVCIMLHVELDAQDTERCHICPPT